MLLRRNKLIAPALEALVTTDRHFKKILTTDDIEHIEHVLRPCSYEAFARTIVGQQLSTKAAATIWARVEALARPFVPEALLALDDGTLRAAGLSGQKVGYLRALSQAVASGAFVPEKLKTKDDESVIAEVTALKGFGRWSAEMLLMFALARPDVFSGGDLGLREGLKRVLGLPERPGEKQAVKLAERWAGRRTAASLLLWQVNKKTAA